MRNSEYLDMIRRHYTERFGAEPASFQPSPADAVMLQEGFCVLRFGPTATSRLWHYATCGMSAAQDDAKLELHLLSPDPGSGLAELLAAVAKAHRATAALGLHSTIGFGRPWWPGSVCNCGLILPPIASEQALEWLGEPGAGVRFLRLVPVAGQEVEFMKKYGIEALEEMFAASGVNLVDPHRKSSLGGKSSQ
jgi:hypothetical protein